MKNLVAYKWAVEAHGNQMYGDLPYSHHFTQVANSIENATADEFVAGLLHDVVEDTEKTLEDIQEVFGKEVSDIVSLLTKQEGTYKENIERIIKSGNVGAIKVKLADNKANLSGDKSHMTKERRNRLVSKYTMSISMLESALSEKES